MKKSRWKSYRLWVAIAALLGMFLKDCGVIDMVDRYDMYVSVILSILVFLGVIHSPEKEVIKEVLEEVEKDQQSTKEEMQEVDQETKEEEKEENDDQNST